MTEFVPTAEDVRALRDAEGLSLCEAKRRIRRHLLLSEIENLGERFISDRERFDRLCAVVYELVENGSV